MNLSKALYIVCANAKHNPDKWPETMEAIKIVNDFRELVLGKEYGTGKTAVIMPPVERPQFTVDYDEN